MIRKISKAILLCGFASIAFESLQAQEVIFVTVDPVDGTTIVDCIGEAEIKNEDCSGNENVVACGTPVRSKKEGNSCQSNLLTLDEAQEFEDEVLVIDDLLITVTGPDGDEGGGGDPSRPPPVIDPPIGDNDEENQRRVGDDTPASQTRPSAPDN